MRLLGRLLSDPIACETPGTSRERQTGILVCVRLIKVLRLHQISPCKGQTSCFRSNWVFRGVTPVGHSRLMGRIIESGVGIRYHSGLTLWNDIDPTTKGFLQILSKVLVA